VAKILLIDDEPLVTQMLEKTLVAEGFKVEVGIMAKEGLEKAKSGKPDLIMLDIMMPDVNGIEVLEKLKADAETKNIPVVMMTNLSGPHEVEMAMSRGALAHWVKGDSDAKQLKEKIMGVLERVGQKPA